LYGAIYNLIRHGMPKFGIESTFVSIEDPENLKKALTAKTKLVSTIFFFKSSNHFKAEVVILT
jgi:O-acetylhomoserine/O-acetylserine sulfhydrylase-like pyridoxal-dependent enzyme